MIGVIITTRDINGTKLQHFMEWDQVCSYIQERGFTDEDEILMIDVEGTCVYSGLMGAPITWDDVTGFFA